VARQEPGDQPVGELVKLVSTVRQNARPLALSGGLIARFPIGRRTSG
jgi:hypothetical protein